MFANYPAPQVARELLDLLASQGLALTDELAEESDPLEVLRQTGSSTNQELTRLVEDALIAAEVKAASTAEPTAYGREVIVAARQLHLPIAVVNNNSPQTVDTYLREHRLSQHVAKTVGRAYADPSRMKPNPAPIFDASVSLGVVPALCVLVGDSLSDIEGAKAAGARVIGYANKPAKKAAFQAAGADALVTSMRQIAVALMQVEGL
ncbi:HAD family phosphatase [Micromonospora globbae]|uniref:HAD family phosphatase n=1 Tax=Micromonospora globbae TaxID=1894969 RepID=UPI0034342C59